MTEHIKSTRHNAMQHRPSGGVFLSDSISPDPLLSSALEHLEEHRRLSAHASKVLGALGILGNDFWRAATDSSFRLSRGSTVDSVDRGITIFTENLLRDKARYSDSAGLVRRGGEQLAAMVISEADVGYHYLRESVYFVGPGAWRRTWLSRIEPGESTVIFNRDDLVVEPQCRAATIDDHERLILDALSVYGLDASTEPNEPQSDTLQPTLNA